MANVTYNMVLNYILDRKYTFDIGLLFDSLIFKMFLIITLAYLIFWGPLFTVTLLNWDWEFEEVRLWENANNSDTPSIYHRNK